MHKCTQISLIVPNIWNHHRDTAEILKLHELGTQLLSNPNKWWRCGPPYNMVYCAGIALISCYE